MNMHVLKRKSQLAILTLISTGSFTTSYFGHLNMSFINPTIQIGDIANAQRNAWVKKMFLWLDENANKPYVRGLATTAGGLTIKSIYDYNKINSPQPQNKNTNRFIGSQFVTSSSHIFYYSVINHHWFIPNSSAEELVLSYPPTENAVVASYIYQNNQGNFYSVQPSSRVVYIPRYGFYQQ